jgi:hypothetical protein
MNVGRFQLYVKVTSGKNSNDADIWPQSVYYFNVRPRFSNRYLAGKLTIKKLTMKTDSIAEGPKGKPVEPLEPASGSILLAHVAQTNLALYQQLHRLGYSGEGLARIRAAYEIATRLFAGHFRPCGRTFIAHLVGTASILATLRAKEPVVGAALLHAAYEQGDFGIVRWRHRRIYVRRAVGIAIEDVVWRYNQLKWYGDRVTTLFDRFDTLSEFDRTIVLMRLANELEDHMNFAHQLSGKLAYDHRQNRETFIAMAERLKQPSLTAALRQVFAEPESLAWLAPLCTNYSGSYQLAWPRRSSLRKLLRFIPTHYLPS